MSHLRLDQAFKPLLGPLSSGVGEFTFSDQVQLGLNLMLPLKSPAQMPALLAILKARMPHVQVALKSLHYVHFARFLPTPDFSTLQVITAYDGVGGEKENGFDFRTYAMDFVGVVNEEFTAILEFVKGAPPLPVEQYPREFIEFISAHNVLIQPWSAYPQLTVLDIQTARVRR
jgi:hypothetical protein